MCFEILGFPGPKIGTLRQAHGRLWGTRLQWRSDFVLHMVAAGVLALTAGMWARAQSRAQEPGQSPVPTALQNRMGSQIPTQVLGRNTPLSQDDVRDQIPVRTAPLPHGEGARRMGERLREKFDGFDWRADPSKPFTRIAYYQMLLTRKLSLPDELAVRMELGNEQMRAGRSERAVETLEELVKRIEPCLDKVPLSIQTQIHQELALAYLRLGEQENCIGIHNSLSCNFPLHGGGIHEKTQGAEGAVREYTQCARTGPRQQPGALAAEPRLHALGRYPQDVPRKWLAPPDCSPPITISGIFPRWPGWLEFTRWNSRAGRLWKTSTATGCWM